MAHLKSRSKKQMQSDFLSHLIECGNISASSELANIERRQVYRWKEDPKFLTAFDEALLIGVDALEDEAIRRGYEGVEKSIYQNGKLVGSVTEYSDTLLIFLLKGRKPSVYKERFEHSGPDGKAIKIIVTSKNHDD